MHEISFIYTKAGFTLNDLYDTNCMTNMVFQIFIAFTLSYKLFKPSS